MLGTKEPQVKRSQDDQAGSAGLLQQMASLQLLERSGFQVQCVRVFEPNQLLSACFDVAHALGSPILWFFQKHIDMVGLSRLLPRCSFQVDVVFRHVCIIQSIYLDVNDFTTTEDEVEVHVGVVDPDTLVASGHGVGCNLRMMLLHVVLNQDHFQRVECRVY